MASSIGVALIMEKVLNYYHRSDVIAIPLDQMIESKIIVSGRAFFLQRPKQGSSSPAIVGTVSNGIVLKTLDGFWNDQYNIDYFLRNKGIENRSLKSI